MKTRITRFLPPVTLALAAVVVADAAALQPRERSPSIFETFAVNQATFVSWATPIGRVETVESRAIVTAVVYEDRHVSQRMRGLRIDLVHLQPPDTCNLLFRRRAELCAMPNAAIYFDEESLPSVRDGVAHGNYDNLIGRWRLSRGVGATTTGIHIGGYTFTGRGLDEVDALIERGTTALQTAPRD